MILPTFGGLGKPYFHIRPRSEARGEFGSVMVFSSDPQAGPLQLRASRRV